MQKILACHIICFDGESIEACQFALFCIQASTVALCQIYNCRKLSVYRQSCQLIWMMQFDLGHNLHFCTERSEVLCSPGGRDVSVMYVDTNKIKWKRFDI